MAIHVNQASGLVGILRPGDRVSVVAIVDPQSAQLAQAQPARSLALPTTDDEEPEPTPQHPPSPAAYAVVSNLRVLLVPQLFRYEETLPTEDEGTFSPVRISTESR